MIYSLVILVLCVHFARSNVILQNNEADNGTYLFEQRAEEKSLSYDDVDNSTFPIEIGDEEKLFSNSLDNDVYVQESADTECITLTESRGNITDDAYKGYKTTNYERCWRILNPDNLLLQVNLKNSQFDSRCYYTHMTVFESDTGKISKYCLNSDTSMPIATYSDVIVRFYIGAYYTVTSTKIHLLYDIDTSLDGVKGVKEARRKGNYWMKYNSSSWAWIENVSKIVTALALSNGTSFNNSDDQEELLLKQNDLRISVTLLKDSVSNEQFSMFINSLLASCHNPRNFYGHDLVKKLKEQVKSNRNFTHPSAFLALCNANESWPEEATSHLTQVFDSQAEYPFLKDIQSFASMAISCKLNRSMHFNSSENSKLISLYDAHIQRMKNEQRKDGSFGNVHRTALITQALLAAQQENKEDWEFKKAVQYLVKAMNSSTMKFLSTYLTLPTLNAKSLAHISSVNCSRKRNHDDLVAEIHDYLGPKIQVQYSLFVGETKDVVHTISLRVPKNFTAYNVMRLADIKDTKYRFLFELEKDKMDIYDISGIPNDPEDGAFWLLYLRSKDQENFNHMTTSPDKLVLNDGDHLVMWYKRAEI